jgi:hypothetical protein
MLTSRVGRDNRPLVTLADAARLSVDTMRAQVREARRRGLLTGTHGRAVGEVTDKAPELLEPVWNVRGTAASGPPWHPRRPDTRAGIRPPLPDGFPALACQG